MTFIIQFIELLISGVASIAQFLLTLPTIFAVVNSIFPPALLTVLGICFSIIIAIRFIELLP